MENWGFRFKKIRERKGLTQYDIARILEKDVTQISRYETGRGAKNITRSLIKLLKDVFSEDEIAYIEKGGEFPLLSDNTSMVQSGSSNNQVFGNANYIEKPIDNPDEDIVMVLEGLKQLEPRDRINVKTILMQLTGMSTEKINKVLMSTVQIGME